MTEKIDFIDGNQFEPPLNGVDFTELCANFIEMKLNFGVFFSLPFYW